MIKVFLNIKILKIKFLAKLCNSVVKEVSHIPEQVIYNFSSHILTEAEKFVLSRGLQFALSPKTLEYADYMTTSLKTLRNGTIKSKLLDTAFSSFDAHKKNKLKINLRKTELHTLRQYRIGIL